MFKIGDLFFALRGDGTQLTKDVEREGAKAGAGLGASIAKSFRDAWSGANIGKGLVQGLGLAGGLGAAKLVADAVGFVKDAFVGTIDSAIQFEKSMANVNSISKFTSRELKDASEAVLRIGADFGQSATTMADGLYDISSSGFQGADALKVLEAATKAATAGLSDASVSSKGLTAVLNAYGESADEAGKVSDVLFQTVNRGVITFPELADQIGKTTALAAPLGVSLEEVAAATSLMTRNGVGAEETFTQINAVMNSMLMPSKQAADLAKELGLQWDAAALRANGLAGQMVQLVEKTGGSEEKMALLLGDTRAVRGAFVLAKNAGKDLTAELGAMQDAAGATDQAFAIQSKSTAFHIAQMNAKIEAAQIQIGEKLLPLVASLADVAVDNLVPALADVADGLQTISDVGATAGDVLAALGGDFEDAGGKSFDFIHAVEDFLAIMNPTKIANTVGLFGDVVANVGHVLGIDLRGGLDAASQGLHGFADDLQHGVGTALATVTGNVEYMADHSTDDIENMRAKASEDLAATSTALDSTGTHATSMASTVAAAGDKAEKSIEDVRKTAETELSKMIDGYFNPIETRYDLSALRAEASEARKQRAAAKTKKAISDANESIIRNLDAQARKLTDLAATGDLTQKDIDAFVTEAKKDYASMGKKVPPELQKVIAKLNGIVRFDGRTVDIDILIEATRDLSKGNSIHLGRAGGGPVRDATPYWVGERGKELFVPSRDGRVLSHDESVRAVSAPSTAAGATYNITVAPGKDVSTLAARRFGQAVLDVVADGLREQTARSA